MRSQQRSHEWARILGRCTRSPIPRSESDRRPSGQRSSHRTVAEHLLAEYVLLNTDAAAQDLLP